MTDQNTDPNTNQPTNQSSDQNQGSSAKPPAFERFVKKLQEAGMSDESISYISGKLFFAVNQDVIMQLVQAGATEEELKKLETIESEEDKLMELEAISNKHAKKSIADLYEEAAEKFVADFEAAGEEE